MLGEQANLKSHYGHIVEIPINLIEHLLVPIRICLVMDNKESKGQGTLLQVTNQAPNTRVSYLKELIKPSLRLSNHPIITGPKLDGNILHIKASFL